MAALALGCGRGPEPAAVADAAAEEPDLAADTHAPAPDAPDAAGDAAISPDAPPVDLSFDVAPPALGPAAAACPPGTTYGNPLPPDLAVTMVRGGFGVTEGPV